MANRRSQTLPVFRKDFEDAIRWSEEHFGDEAADRYRVLVRHALRDLVANPLRPGVKARPDLAKDMYVYHLIFSRDSVPDRQVKHPRHLVMFRYKGEIVEFGRLLHDGRDLVRHLPRGYTAL
jgi:toxin ParE1/3/4